LTNLKKTDFARKEWCFDDQLTLQFDSTWFSRINQRDFFTKQTNKQMMDFTSSDDMEFNLLWLIWNMMTDHWIFRLRHAMCEVKIGSEPTKVRDSNHSNR
jgi:GH35 family endo-1,4-beta-xylanase